VGVGVGVGVGDGAGSPPHPGRNVAARRTITVTANIILFTIDVPPQIRLRIISFQKLIY